MATAEMPVETDVVTPDTTMELSDQDRRAKIASEMQISLGLAQVESRLQFGAIIADLEGHAH